MKLLTLVWLSVHGYSVVFSGDQCRALRQAQIGVSQCRQLFASHRAVSANLSSRTRNATADSSPPGSTSIGGPAGGRPSGSPGSPAGGPGAPGSAGGSPGGPSGPASGGGSPGGSPGNPGGGAGSAGGDIRPGEPIPAPPPQKPTIDPAVVRAVVKAVQEGARERVIDRIIHGAKPPDTGNGKPPAGFNPGPGGMRGQASPKSSGGAPWAGQAR